MSQAFDIVYAPVTLAPPTRVYTLARGVNAIDRAHALLRWFRDEFGLTIDPVTMLDLPDADINGFGTYELACGCEVLTRFQMDRLGRLDRWRTAEVAVPRAEVECEPCNSHGQTRDWNGTIAAWTHDPKRPDEFERT